MLSNVWKLYPEWFTVSTLVDLYETNTSQCFCFSSFVTLQKLLHLYLLFLSHSRSSKASLPQAVMCFLEQQWNQSDRSAKAILLSYGLILAPFLFLSFFMLSSPKIILKCFHFKDILKAKVGFNIFKDIWVFLNKDVVNVVLWHQALICNTFGLKGLKSLTKVASTFMSQSFHISCFNKVVFFSSVNVCWRLSFSLIILPHKISQHLFSQMVKCYQFSVRNIWSPLITLDYSTFLLTVAQTTDKALNYYHMFRAAIKH